MFVFNKKSVADVIAAERFNVFRGGKVSDPNAMMQRRENRNESLRHQMLNIKEMVKYVQDAACVSCGGLFLETVTKSGGNSSV